MNLFKSVCVSILIAFIMSACTTPADVRRTGAGAEAAKQQTRRTSAPAKPINTTQNNVPSLTPIESKFSLDKFVPLNAWGVVSVTIDAPMGKKSLFIPENNYDIKILSQYEQERRYSIISNIHKNRKLTKSDHRLVCILFKNTLNTPTNISNCHPSYGMSDLTKGKENQIIQHIFNTLERPYTSDLVNFQHRQINQPYGWAYRKEFNNKYPNDTANFSKLEDVLTACLLKCTKEEAHSLINDISIAGIQYGHDYVKFEGLINKYGSLSDYEKIITQFDDEDFILVALKSSKLVPANDRKRLFIEAAAAQRIKTKKTSSIFREAYYRSVSGEKLKIQYDSASTEDKKLIEEITLSQYQTKEAVDDFSKSLYFKNLDDAALNQAYKSANAADKQALEKVIVPRFAEKLAIYKYSATGGNDNAYGASGSGFGNQLTSALFGSKTGVERSTPVHYSMQLDPALLKISGTYKYTATIVLTAHGEGEYETHCAWPLPTTCKRNKTEDTYTADITGTIQGNQIIKGVQEIKWSPKYFNRGMSGLTSGFRTDRVSVNIWRTKLEPL